MIYDINVVTWLRKHHNILGVLIGTLPQAPQQNVFLGLPLELLPEEARFIVAEGIGYCVNDHEWHQSGAIQITAEQRDSYKQDIAQESEQTAKRMEKKRVEKAENVLQRRQIATTTTLLPKAQAGSSESQVESAEDAASLFESSTSQRGLSPQLTTNPTKQWAVTPTSANPPLPTPPRDPSIPLPKVKESSYAVFKRLHDEGYFVLPGLRFGCQFMAYPGDPLRYHSHFLVNGYDWDEEFELLDIVGGGRLGTGVKKAFLLGGVEPESGLETPPIRTFCVEWGRM